MLNFNEVTKKIVIRNEEKDNICIRTNKYVSEKNPYGFYNYLNGAENFFSYLRGKTISSLAVPFFFKICDGKIEATVVPTKEFIASANTLYYASVESTTYIPASQVVKCETEHPARSFFIEKIYTVDSVEASDFERKYIVFSQNIDVLLKINKLTLELYQTIQRKVIALEASDEEFTHAKREIIKRYANINSILAKNKDKLIKNEENGYSLQIRSIPEDENIRNLMDIAAIKQVYFADPTILCGYQMASMLKNPNGAYIASETTNFVDGMEYEDIHDCISGTKEDIETMVNETIIPTIEKFLGKCKTEYRIFKRSVA